MANKETKYVEPSGYFSKEMRKALEIGEYSSENKDKKKNTKSTTKASIKAKADNGIKTEDTLTENK